MKSIRKEPGEQDESVEAICLQIRSAVHGRDLDRAGQLNHLPDRESGPELDAPHGGKQFDATRDDLQVSRVQQ